MYFKAKKLSFTPQVKKIWYFIEHDMQVARITMLRLCIKISPKGEGLALNYFAD